MKVMQLISALTNESIDLNSELTCLFAMNDKYGKRFSVNGVMYSEKDENDLKVCLSFHMDLDLPKNETEEDRYEISSKPAIRIIDIISKLVDLVKTNIKFADANVYILSRSNILISGIEIGVCIGDEGVIPYANLSTVRELNSNDDELQFSNENENE